jgi:hypothetical protein
MGMACAGSQERWLLGRPLQTGDDNREIVRKETAGAEPRPLTFTTVPQNDDQAAFARRDWTMSKRSAFITLVQALTKSFTNFSCESEHA